MPETATTGLCGKKVSATIHQGDVDWYKFEVLDTSQPYSFVLMDIPSGCDYDMLLLTSDLTTGYAQYQDGNTTEEFYIYLPEVGTYYVGIGAHSGYSDSPYTLYFGPAYQTGSTGWRDPGLSFKFGYVPKGSSTQSVAAQSYNLTYDASIPINAIMTSLYMTAEGSTTEWAGFTKYMAPEAGSTLSQIGNAEAFAVPDMTYYVKQNWRIYGTIQYSMNFTWTPRILIGYKYVVSPKNMSYVR